MKKIAVISREEAREQAIDILVSLQNGYKYYRLKVKVQDMARVHIPIMRVLLNDGLKNWRHK